MLGLILSTDEADCRRTVLASLRPVLARRDTLCDTLFSGLDCLQGLKGPPGLVGCCYA